MGKQITIERACADFQHSLQSATLTDQRIMLSAADRGSVFMRMLAADRAAADVLDEVPA